MRISEKGKNLIKSFEGVRLKAYKVLSSERYYTIGYGHYGEDVTKDMVITMETANKLFDKDIQKYENAVNNFTFSFQLNQNQFDALTSFCYNLGPAILNDFRSKTANQIANEMLLYVNAGGTRLQGLVTRRKKEVELFNAPIEKTAENTTEKIIKEYTEYGTFFPSTKIFFRNKPLITNDNTIIGDYRQGESVNYDHVCITSKYVYISWISATSGIRRYMPIREYNNGNYGIMWGLIK